MKNNDIKHDGHRERLTNLIENAGLENVSDIQAVEYFLTYIFPRGDVNPLAHRLLDRYETFANIVTADKTDLMTLKGINSRSAQKIKDFASFFNYFVSSQMTKRMHLKTQGQFLNFIEKLLRFQKTENLYIFAVDNSFRLIQKRVFDMKLVREVGIPPMEIYRFIASTKLSYMLIAHNHPNGSARHSPDDHNAMEFIDSLIKNLDCKLIDSFIVGEDGIYSERENSYVRKYNEEKIINFLD